MAGQGFRARINVDIATPSRIGPRTNPPKASPGAPNVLYIVLDDVGFSAMSGYGGPIPTPTIDRIVADGVRFTQWHTTCSLLADAGRAS
jgi:arylsulfatase